jgi:hypothetical protein
MEAAMKSKSPVSVLFFAAALALPVIASAQLSSVSVITPKSASTTSKAYNDSRLVVITTPLASGHLQSVSFLPPVGPMTQAQAARWIDLARDDLLARGIDKPTALQIAIVLLGGTLTTPDGDLRVPGLLPKAQRRDTRPNQMQVVYNGPYV